MNQFGMAGKLLLTVALIFCLLVGVTPAQRRRKPQSDLPSVYETPQNDRDLSGRFTFTRIQFDMPMLSGYAFRALGDGGPPWSHDYPVAGRHLMKIMSELSKIDASLDVNEPIFRFTDPQLFKHPFAYLCEVGYMSLSDEEIKGMREYLLRGGFLLVDDFRTPQELAVFTEQVKRAMPEYQLKKLDLSHAVFNCFFSIKTLDLGAVYSHPGYPGAMSPEFLGMEDETGRLMMIVNYNYDVSDYWQWSNDPFRPIEETNEAYKFGVNYIIYALTH